MSERVHIRPASGEGLPEATPEQAVFEDFSQALQLQTLVQLTEQIRDAVLIVEHPQLAIHVLAARQQRRAA